MLRETADRGGHCVFSLLDARVVAGLGLRETSDQRIGCPLQPDLFCLALGHPFLYLGPDGLVRQRDRIVSSGDCFGTVPAGWGPDYRPRSAITDEEAAAASSMNPSCQPLRNFSAPVSFVMGRLFRLLVDPGAAHGRPFISPAFGLDPTLHLDQPVHLPPNYRLQRPSSWSLSIPSQPPSSRPATASPRSPSLVRHLFVHTLSSSFPVSPLLPILLTRLYPAGASPRSACQCTPSPEQRGLGLPTLLGSLPQQRSRASRPCSGSASRSFAFSELPFRQASRRTRRVSVILSVSIRPGLVRDGLAGGWGAVVIRGKGFTAEGANVAGRGDVHAGS